MRNVKTRLPSPKPVVPAAFGPRDANATPQVRHILHAPRPQAKLTVGAPDDAFEREADQVADQVMRMPEPAVQRMCSHCQEEMEGEGVVRRVCSECEEEMQAKEAPGETPSVPEGFEQRFDALQGGGRPLPASERAFFEPRFGRDFSNVRLHSGPAASELARSVHARAFTLGDAIVLGSGETGRQLLAHELTHVVQQGGAAPGIVRRQTIHSSCSEHEAILHAAWAEGERLARQTADSLDTLMVAYGQGQDPEQIAPGALAPYRNAFGDDILGSLTDLSSKFRSIERGFTKGKTLRCDPGSTPEGQEDCEQYGAFVLPDNRTDIFICPAFFDAEKSATERGVTLVHEMAHSVFGIKHYRGVKKLLGCDASFGLRYTEAIQNAHAYSYLVNCLHGEGPDLHEVKSRIAPPAQAPRAGRSGSRWSISGSLGTGLTSGAQRFAATLGGSLSLRPGEYAIWNPRLGLNLLYLRDPSQIVAATAEVGVRIQQPVKGLYFDVSGGGFASFDAPRGLTGTVGLGFRTKRLELGAEARAVVPGTEFGDADVLILGRAAWRFR